MVPRFRSPLSRRVAVAAAILFLSASSFWALSHRLAGHVHKAMGARFLEAETFDSAADHLNRAAGYLPQDSEIHRMLGDLSLERSIGAMEMEQIFDHAVASADHFSKALALNPMDAESAFGLARVRERMEILAGYGYSCVPCPDADAGHFYRTALKLRPNGIRFAYGLARYLHAKGLERELRETVRRLARTYPPVVRHFRSEPFWSPEIREACREGLRAAVAEGISLRHAHEQLSELFAQEEGWDEAISHYEAAMEIDVRQNTSRTLFRLGMLNLKAGGETRAVGLLLDAVAASHDPEAEMKRVFDLFAQQKRADPAEEFHSILKERFPLYRERVEILWARFLMDQKRLDEARGVLEAVAQGAGAEAYFLLARIAQEEKDWDRAELAIQKATVLEPRNVQYHLMFSRVLQRLGKLDRAQHQADAVIRLSPEPTPGTYNHRANIRWRRGDPAGAAEDWKQASHLAPNQPVFHAKLGRAQEKLGNRDLAVSHYKAALALEPDNDRYRRQLRALAERK